VWDATEGVRLQGVSDGRVIPAAVPMIHQPQAAVKPLGGEELLCQGHGQGAGQDAAVGVVPQVALAQDPSGFRNPKGLVAPARAKAQRRPRYYGAALQGASACHGFPCFPYLAAVRLAHSSKSSWVLIPVSQALPACRASLNKAFRRRG
jgi:hypothetical protein